MNSYIGKFYGIITSPNVSLAYLYLFLGILVSIGLLLMVFIEIKVQHPRHIIYGILLLLLIAIPALFLGLGEYELLSPDEPREGEIAWEMWVSKNFAVPTLNGEAFLEKPPLFYWSVVAAFSIANEANAFLASWNLVGLHSAPFLCFISSRIRE